LDKSARLLISETMAADILKTYKRLGKDWLFKVAQERPDLFINQCLSRLLPPAFKEGADVEFNQQINVGQMSDFEAARRVAFALNLGIAAQQEQQVVAEVSPRQACQAMPSWRPDVPEPLLQPDMPVEDPAKALWLEELSLTAEQRRDNALVRSSKTGSIESYPGSILEQGGHGPIQRQPVSKPSAAELCRRVRNRRDDLL
jgi:hypothetical protein